MTVGLPARGKTYIAQKVTRYLNWLGIPTRVFNVGDYRRRFCGAAQRHAFFDAKNREAEEARAAAAQAALEDMLRWLRETEGQVAIYDATNTTVHRREMIREACKHEDVSVPSFPIHHILFSFLALFPRSCSSSPFATTSPSSSPTSGKSS